MTITHDALDLTVQASTSPGPLLPQTSHLGPLALASPLALMLVTSGGHHWRSVQTGSFEDPMGVTSCGGY